MGDNKEHNSTNINWDIGINVKPKKQKTKKKHKKINHKKKKIN